MQLPLARPVPVPPEDGPTFAGFVASSQGNPCRSVRMATDSLGRALQRRRCRGATSAHGQRDRQRQLQRQLHRGQVGPRGSGRTDPVLDPGDGRARSPRCRRATPPTSTPRSAPRRPRSPSGRRRHRRSAPRSLLKFADRIEEHGDELSQIESRNVGKPIAAVGDEVWFAADNLRFFAGAARCLEGRGRRRVPRAATRR